MEAQTAVSTPRYLNERSVALLESHWADLKEEAYCEQADHGWRIRMVKPSRVFREAGFHDQEVVAPDALLRYAKSSGQKGLVERLLAIFEHIKKH